MHLPVNREEQNTGILPEHLLRCIAMMNIPIHN